MTTTTASGRSYPARFLLALVAAFLLVAGASIAVGGKGQDALGLLAGTLVILVLAVPSAAISAYFLQRDLSLALAAQALTVLGMAGLQLA